MSMADTDEAGMTDRQRLIAFAAILVVAFLAVIVMGFLV
jgi:hypothetical protein